MSRVYLDSSASGYQARVRRLMWIVLATIGVLVLRLGQLQLIEGDELHDSSIRNFARSTKLPANRGTILDRQGRVLAINRPSFDLYVIPGRVRDIEGLLTGLRDVLQIDELDALRLRERIEEPRGMWRQRSILVSRDIDRKKVAQAEALRAQVDGISIQVRYQREYPYGEIGAHLLGYMGKPRREELEGQNRYTADSLIGRSGLERRYEELLRGEDGFERYIVDARGAKADNMPWAERALEKQAVRREPQRGMDIQLTVDAEVQRLLLNSMSRYESGAAVLMDPRNGEILGMVSKPGFDPNAWSGRLTPEAKRQVDESPYNPMFDKSVQSYFPGSVYKVVAALAALEEGILDPNQLIESPGYYEYGNRIFHCYKRAGHGKVDLYGALAASADVYFYRLGEQLGIDKMATYAERFGFGTKPGLGINGESAGIVPTKAYHEKHTAGGFQHGLALSTAIGQGAVMVSPVQLATAFSALANGGTVYEPRVVQRVLTEEGNEVTRYDAQVRGNLNAKPEHIAMINTGLIRVVNDPNQGTGHSAAIPGVVVAGKTGTAQVREIQRGPLTENVKRFKDRDHAWFAGFAPAESPRLVVVVFLEHGGGGGKDAAPVARAILEGYHQRIEPVFSTTATYTPPKRRNYP